jgi:hypothetical protein
LYKPLNPLNNNTAVVGSGIEEVEGLVPSTTMLSMRLFPVEEVAPLNTTRNAAFGLLFNPAILTSENTSGKLPNAVAGTYGDPKSMKLMPSRLY